MELRFQYDCAGIDWEYVSQTLKQVGMAGYKAEVQRKAFINSHKVVFVFDGDKLVGFGRAVSDGTCQAALYDIAVLPEYQGKGIGEKIVQSIIRELPTCNFILYAAPGKEGFYEKLRFKRMKTGMALFINAAGMREHGFTE